MARGDNDKFKQSTFAPMPTKPGNQSDSGIPPTPPAQGALGDTPPSQPAYARGGKIHIKKSHEGLMHKDLDKAPGAPITSSDIAKEKQGGPAAKKRAVFAENAKKWHH